MYCHMEIVRKLSGLPHIQRLIIMDAIVLGRDSRGWRKVHDEITMKHPVSPGGPRGLFLRITTGMIPHNMHFYAITRTSAFYSQGRKIYNWTKQKTPSCGGSTSWVYGQSYSLSDLDRSMT